MTNIIPLPTSKEAFESFCGGFSCFSEVEPYLLNSDDIYLNKCLDLIPHRLNQAKSELQGYIAREWPNEAIEHIRNEIEDYENALRKYRPEVLLDN